MKAYYKLLFASCCMLVLLFSCAQSPESYSNQEKERPKSGVELIVLGTVQDGGSPHMACRKACCVKLHESPDYTRKVVSLGLLDYDNLQSFMFEASPDFVSQSARLQNELGEEAAGVPTGIFLSHAHMGHYTGLTHLGREAMNAKQVNCYVMPRMNAFLENNGPWSQLIDLENIRPVELKADSAFQLNSNIRITAFLVPHRDEFSETAGFLIQGPRKKLLFIPDIDKWSKWERSIVDLIQEVDYAFIDATFYDQKEIPNRNMKEIPHPFVVESMELLKSLSAADKAKVYFIHFNHTNPLLSHDSKEFQSVLNQGFNVSQIKQVFKL